MFSTILVANDGSEGGFRALETALDLAKHYHAAVRMVSVEELPNFPASIDEVVEEKENHKFHDVVVRARKMARARRTKLDIGVIVGHPVAADLLVVGFMGHSALYERIIGGTADRLVRLAPCPVLVVK